MSDEDQRRIPRVGVCCRVDVRDQFGVWTAITDDVSARGCRLLAAKLPRVGSVLELTISSDLFPECLEVTGEVAWASEERIGVNFLEAPPRRRGRRAMSPAEWVESAIEHGRVHHPGPVAPTIPRVLPAVVRRSPAPLPPRARTAASAAPDSGDDGGMVLPIRKR